jgi:hypothetical protein
MFERIRIIRTEVIKNVIMNLCKIFETIPNSQSYDNCIHNYNTTTTYL